MKYYTRTTDTQNIKILAKILLSVIEDKEMDKEYVKSILTQIYKNGFYAIEMKGEEKNE